MSDDGNSHDEERSFEELYRDAIDASELLGDKPDINEWLDLGDDDHQYYEEAWDHAPIEDFTDGQMEAFVEMLLEVPFDEWDEMLEMWDEGDFWDWWEDNYGET